MIKDKRKLSRTSKPQLRQLNFLGYVLHNVAKNGEKCLKECDNLSKNSVQLS